MAAISATFAAGDTLRVVARSNGQVEIYKNTTLLGTRDASAWTYSAQGGYIGLWSLNGPNTLFDDFGGGTYAGASGPARADDPQPAAKALRRIAAQHPAEQHPAALPPVVVDLGRVAERAAQAVADIQARAHTWGLRSATAEPEPKGAAALFAPIQRAPLAVTPVSPIAGEVFRLYVSAGARPVAVRSIAAGGATSVQYLHPDHLGSIGQITDANRNWVQDLYFKPYGGVRWAQSGILGPDSDSATRRTYTGQYEETSQWVGSLMHYKARYYSPFLHRFTQADTIAPGIHDPQGHNRYLYARGNPINANDPSGHCSVSIATPVGAITFEVPLADCPDMIDLRVSETEDGGDLPLTERYTDPDVLSDRRVLGEGTDVIRGPDPSERYSGPDVIGDEKQESENPWSNLPSELFTANPNGKNGGTGHQNGVQDAEVTIRDMGLTPQREYFVPTLGGNKGSRFVDVAGLDSDGNPQVFFQVGRANQDGRPVSRERQAIEDIWNHTPDGIPIVFLPYDQRGV